MSQPDLITLVDERWAAWEASRKGSKYGAKAVMIDGHRFASKKEAGRYAELRLLQQAGVIADLVLQPRFDLVVNGQKICRYFADFRYTDGGVDVVEDVKSQGTKTPVYRLKRKLMKACHGIEVRET